MPIPCIHLCCKIYMHQCCSLAWCALYPYIKIEGRYTWAQFSCKVCKRTHQLSSRKFMLDPGRKPQWPFFLLSCSPCRHSPNPVQAQWLVMQGSQNARTTAQEPFQRCSVCWDSGEVSFLLLEQAELLRFTAEVTGASHGSLARRDAAGTSKMHNNC